MKKRITWAIVSVSVLVVVLLGVPLAIVVERFYQSRATIELQRSAALVVAEVTLPLDVAEIADMSTETDVPADFSIYDKNGALLYGDGPPALTSTLPDELVVSSPITDRTTEDVVGSVLVSRSRNSVDGDVRRTWGLMTLAAGSAIVVSYFVARREAERLSAPITDLVVRAERLGSGQLSDEIPPPSIEELRVLDEALRASEVRLSELIAREREFSDNASHQLRTPLAALAVNIERGDLDAAGSEVQRLTSTVEHMLALAREGLPRQTVVDIGGVLRATAQRWEPVFRAAGRELLVTSHAELPGAGVRPTSVDQALQVLLENALRHGAGTVAVTGEAVAGGVAIGVCDDGDGIDPREAASIFERHEGRGTGIGLDLARTLIEADGGRLLLVDPERASFRMIFAAARSDQAE